jgi:hypothetical protein
MKAKDIVINIAFLATSSASTSQLNFRSELLFANVKIEDGIFDNNLIPKPKIEQIYNIEELVNSSKTNIKIKSQKPRIEDFLNEIYNSKKNYLSHIDKINNITYKSNQR